MATVVFGKKWLLRLTLNQGVRGSSPRRPTSEGTDLMHRHWVGSFLLYKFTNLSYHFISVLSIVRISYNWYNKK